MREIILDALPADPDPGTLLRVDLAAVQAADVRQLRTWVDGQGGPISVKGRVLKAVETMRARERDLHQSLTELGIGPRARAALGGTDTPREALAAQAHRELLEKYAPKALPQ